MKAIVVKAENIHRIEEVLQAVQGRCSARTITAKQIVEAADAIISHYAALAGSKKAINGCYFSYDCNNQDFPNAYRYVHESTIVRFKFSSGTMKIIKIYRVPTFRASASVHAVLTDAAKMAIAENAACCNL